MKHRAPDVQVRTVTGRHRDAAGQPAGPARTRHRRAMALVVGLGIVGSTVIAVVSGVAGNGPAKAAAAATPAVGDTVGAAAAPATAEMGAEIGVGVAATPPVDTEIAPTVPGTPVAAADTSARRPGCPLDGGSLTVAAAPAVGAVIRRLLDAGALVPAGCTVALTLVEPADLLDSLADPNTAPAVWIPDSSLWFERATEQGIEITGITTSLATTPVVMALTATAASQLAADGHPSLDAVLRTRTTPNPVRVGLPDPARSAIGALAVVDLQRTLDGAADRGAALTWALRSTPTGTDLGPAALTDGLLVATTEQAVRAAAVEGPAPVTIGAPTPSTLDHPFAVLGDDPQVATVAAALLAELQSPSARQALLNNGFRLPDGAGKPADGAVAAALREYAVANAPSRMLAVIDTSGSMAAAVPGTSGATRLNLAKEAAQRGLSLYDDDSEIGIWIFSRHLDGVVDHRELVAIDPLAATVDAVSVRDRVASALASISVVPDGDTGLYDTTLAAIRAVRDGWVPGRINSVLLLTDGVNDDRGSIDLPTLLATIAAENDPARPVPVIAIGFGPDTDTDALGAITAATGGATYVADDPRQIGEIFLDAVGRRSCRPGC